jgi:4-hydroxybutyryl-CoA dehydratase / vinylacetyl-CoA-Delta-isomerase
MALRTAEEYKRSIVDGREVFVDGKRVEDLLNHPSIGIYVEYAAGDYRMAMDPKYRDLVTEKLPDGEQVHFTFVSPRSKEDLIRRREVIQTSCRVLGGPGGAKFTGIDGLNGLTLGCKRIDTAMGTEYSKRVDKYRRYLIDIDAAVCVCMTDVKGNRSLHPHQQRGHQDYYVHMVSKGDDGIVVRGAKSHISYSAITNEMIVLPCRAMGEKDKDYAVAFAVPINAKGLKIIGNARDASHPMVVFDDVFVPSERVFLAGEWQYSAQLPYAFSTFHRLSADSYKYVQLETMIGAAALHAEYNGLDKVSHVRDKLSWLVMYAEGTEALGRAAAENCEIDPTTGVVHPNIMYSNVAKYFFASQYAQAEHYLQDIAGGLVCTLPSLQELENPEISEYVKKYLGTGEICSAEDRMKLFRYTQHLCDHVEGNITIHAEGSLASQRLMLYGNANWDRFKAFAKRAAGIPCNHPVLADYSPIKGARIQYFHD